MVQRALFGKLGSAFGGWVSKPGIDVVSAQPGQFLLDTSSQVFQSVAAGDSLLAQNPGVGNVSSSVALPSTFASYSRFVVWSHLYEFNVTRGSTTWTDAYNGNFTCAYATGGGNLSMTLVSAVDYSKATTPAIDTIQLRLAWIIFRALF